MSIEAPTKAPPPDQAPLLTYAVLAGLTPLIPIPFVDDLARDYFRRRLVQTLAAARGVSLSREAVGVLAAEPSGCLAAGCLVQVLLFVPRLVFRKLFFWLEWKRSLDLTSQTYHFGYLVDCALQDGFLDPTGGLGVDTVRQAILDVCREAPIRPVETAVKAAFQQSKSGLRNAVRTLLQALRNLRGRRDSAGVEDTLTAVDAEERREVAGVVEALQSRLQGVPEAHFQRLREQLRSRLA